MNDKTTATKAQNKAQSGWRDAIKDAIKHARGYAKAVADDYADDWRATNTDQTATDDDRRDAARRPAKPGAKQRKDKTMNDKTTATKAQNKAQSGWRDAIKDAIKHARGYAKAVADDYADDWRATNTDQTATDDDRRDAARRLGSAGQHAADWYATAEALEEALNNNPDDDTAAAEAIKDRIKNDGRTEQADWCNPITDELREATKRATDDGSRNASQAAEHLAQAWAEAERWG